MAEEKKLDIYVPTIERPGKVVAERMAADHPLYNICIEAGEYFHDKATCENFIECMLDVARSFRNIPAGTIVREVQVRIVLSKAHECEEHHAPAKKAKKPVAKKAVKKVAKPVAKKKVTAKKVVKPVAKKKVVAKKRGR